MNNFVGNIVLAILPPTRFFGLKRLLLRLLGIGVGDGTRICGAVKFYGAGRVQIGERCWVGIGVKFYTSIGADVLIGDQCDIAPDVAFMCGSHQIGDQTRRAGSGKADTIRVGAGTWIGIRSTLLGGTELAPACVVGAGSLVLGKTYPASCVIQGVPAKVVRYFNNDARDVNALLASKTDT